MEWKKVSEELPEEGELVLCKIENIYNFAKDYTLSFYTRFREHQKTGKKEYAFYPQTQNYGNFYDENNFIGFNGYKLTYWAYFNEPEVENDK